jgi:hypothetical protein
MAAIISDKFRIFNAGQFLESLSEGSTDTGVERTRMYFFVGRSQRWDSYLEIYSKNATAFVAGQEVYVGSSYASATFKAKIRVVNADSLLLYDVLPSSTASPNVGSTLKGWNGTSDTGAQALTGVYRYATEDVPPVPLDNQAEKYDIYDDIIAAKRVTSTYARTVIRRYNWDLVANPKFDMWKPDYSATPGGGGQIGKSGATGASSISDAKFYVVNSNYEVFKCLYNGQSPANPTGTNATYEPKTTPAAGQGTYASGIYSEPSGTYIWKYLFTIPTDDVLRFLSTDFMPIVDSTNATRVATEAAAVDGEVRVVLVEAAGANLPNGTHYAPITGDGTGGKVQIVVSGGAITSVSVTAAGSGYTYATVALATGTGSGATAYGLFSDSALTAAVTVASNATGALEPIISPQGGHGANLEEELNGKRVMLNIRLTYAEGSGDFPVDNDFRRIGILRNPLLNGTTDYATVDTLNGLYSVKITGATAGFVPDETITQTVTGGTALGTVVSWTLDSGSTTAGVLKYIQSPQLHKNNGVVRAFESNASNAITGGISLASGAVDTTFADGTVLLGSTFTDGLALPEIKNNSGEVIYIENRRLITRAPDQIEDIKLVIEF